MREGSAPQRADAWWTHRGMTGAGGVRAPCRRDDSKTKDNQVDAGCCSLRFGAPRRATRSRSTTSPATRRGATNSGHVRVIARGSQSVALPRPAGSEEPAVAVLLELNKCLLELLLPRRAPLAGRRRLGESGWRHRHASGASLPGGGRSAKPLCATGCAHLVRTSTCPV